MIVLWRVCNRRSAGLTLPVSLIVSYFLFRPSPPTPIVPRVHSLVVHNTEPHVHSFLALIDPTGHYLAVAVNTEMKAAGKRV